MKATIHVDGRSVQAEFSECILHISGEFGGNLDFSVRFSEPVPTEKVLQNLRLKLPDKERLIDVAGYGEIVGGLEINMGSNLVPPGEDIPASAVPPNVEVFWLEKDRSFPVGTLRVNAQAGAADEQQEGAYHEPSTPEGGIGCGTTIFAILTALLTSVLASAIP